MSNILNFPIIPRATVHIAHEDETDPHTAAFEGLKKAIEYSNRRCGKAWTLNVLKSAIEVDDVNGWRNRARRMFDRKETV